MIPYLIMAILPIFIMLFKPYINVINTKNNVRLKEIGLIIFALIVLFFTCSRSNYLGSGDNLEYFRLIKKAYVFDSLGEYLNYVSCERGFTTWVWILSRIFSNPQIIMIINSIFIVLPGLFFIKKYSDDIYFSCFLYITFCTYRFSLQGMRQAMAMGVCLLALDYAYKKRFLPFVLCVLLAMSFHKSAIIFLPVYLLFMFAKNRKDKIPLVLMVTLAGVIFGSEFLDVANVYMGNKNYGNIISGGVPTAIIYLLVIAGVVITYKNYRNDDLKISMAYMSLVSIALFFTRYTVAHVSERLGYYYQASFLITIPSIISYINKKEKYLYKAIVIIVILGLYIYQLLNSDLIPYKFYWN